MSAVLLVISPLLSKNSYGGTDNPDILTDSQAQSYLIEEPDLQYHWDNTKTTRDEWNNKGGWLEWAKIHWKLYGKGGHGKQDLEQKINPVRISQMMDN